MARIVKWVAEFMTLLVGAGAWGMELWGQKIAGHEVDWKIIAIAASIAFVVLAFLHMLFLNWELGEMKSKRVDVHAVFDSEKMHDRTQRWYRIGVHNRSRRAVAENVEVKLEQFDPCPLGFVTIELPVRLGRKDAGKERRADEVITINPDMTELFDLVQHMGDNTVKIWTTIFQQQVTLDEGQPYRLKIRLAVGNPNDKMPKGGRVEEFIVRLNGGELEVYHASDEMSAA